MLDVINLFGSMRDLASCCGVLPAAGHGVLGLLQTARASHSVPLRTAASELPQKVEVAPAKRSM